MRKLVLGGVIVLLALGGCGKKEFPQPDTSKPLQLIDLKATKEVNVLHLHFTIVGGYGNVGYQIDRAEVDPTCSCLTDWQRFFEQPPLPGQKGTIVERNLNLLDPSRTFAFRIRAVDSVGSLSPWSKPIRARADPNP